MIVLATLAKLIEPLYHRGSNVTFTEGVGSRQQRRQKASDKKKDRER